MSDDDQSGGSSPSSAQEDESTDSEIAGFDAATALTELRDEIGEAQADAMVSLEDQYNVETEPELYDLLGFEDETVTLELTLDDAEAFILVDWLDNISQKGHRPESFVPLARLFDEVLSELPAAAVGRWVENEYGQKQSVQTFRGDT